MEKSVLVEIDLLEGERTVDVSGCYVTGNICKDVNWILIVTIVTLMKQT
jgi:hypothetical protein